MKKFILLFIILITLVSCDSINDNLVERAKRYEKNITKNRNTVNKNDSLFDVYLTKSKISNYAKKENLDKNFVEANTKLDKAKKIYDTEVKPLLDKNESKSESILKNKLNEIFKLYVSADSLSQVPQKRMVYLTNINDNFDQFKNDTEAKLGSSTSVVNSDEEFAKRYYSTYPDKKTTIDKDLNKNKSLLNTMETEKNSIDSEYTKYSNKSEYNLTKIGDSYNKINELNKAITAQDKYIRSHLKELDKSYSKILKDMKPKFYIEVGRSSWDSYSDYGSDHEINYPWVEVDEKTFKYFDELPNNTTIAKETSSGKGAPKVYVDKSYWNKLKVDHKYKYPKGDDDSEYWVNNTKIEYYHLYIIENNGVRKDTSWEKVSEKFFNSNLNNMGMSIISKPIGLFDDEATKQASPAGMAYVGNSNYGEWKKDSNGETFWSFYGKYMFFNQLLGGYNYRRYEYDDYNRNYRNRKPYYGSRNQTSYGTRGTRYVNSASYRNSTYNKKYGSNSSSSFSRNNIKKSYSTRSTSSTRSQSSSSRTGSSRRGGGPSRGGK